MTPESIRLRHSARTAPIPLEAEIRAQTERILASKHFRQAASLERFLRYIIEKSLAGASQELKEYVIGVEVFQRGPDFEPGADALVRVQAGKLRKKLQSYYEEEGAEDPILIELPKGHYVATFSTRASLAASPEPAESIGMESEAPAVSVPVPITRPWRSRVAIAATFILGVLSVMVLQQLKPFSARTESAAIRQTNPPQSDAMLSPLWENFLKPGASNMIAFGTPLFFSMNGIYFRDVRVNASSDFHTSPELVGIQKNLRREMNPTEIYTGVGEAQGVYLLSRFFFTRERDVRVARNRLVGWEQIKNGNLVLLSSLRFHTVADELALPSDFTISEDVSGDIINKRPQNGEQPIYPRNAKDDYAVVTLWPGKRPDSRVLHLSGATTWATVAAAEYVTEAERLQELNRHLAECSKHAGREQHAPYFQVLLHVEVKDNQPVGISYVTHHDLDIHEPQTQMAIMNKR